MYEPDDLRYAVLAVLVAVASFLSIRPFCQLIVWISERW